MEPVDFDRYVAEIERSPEEDFVDLRQVLSVQSLAMGVFREAARREVIKHKMTGFVLLDRTEGEMGSDGVDTYMGFMSRRLSYDYWQFTASFLRYEMTDHLRYTNYRELYRYNWNTAGKCIGTYITTLNYNPITSTREDEDLGRVDTVEPHIHTEWGPLSDNDTPELKKRMYRTISNIESKHRKKCTADWKFVG
jgi:hypothetical protein